MTENITEKIKIAVIGLGYVGLPLARLYQEMKNMGIQIKGRKDMYKACIFDLDGTIADTVESIAYVGNKTLEHFHLPPIPVKDYNFYRII